MDNIEYTTKIKTPGERLKYIRSLAQLTREAIKAKFNISSATLRSWEEDKVNISEEKIKACIEAYRSVGILTNLEWIKTGEGLLPTIKGKEPKFVEQLLYNNIDSNEKIDAKFLVDQNINSSLFISYIDREERFTFVNEKYQTVFDKKIPDIIGRTLEDLVGEQGYRNIKPYIDKTFSGEEVTFEYPWKYGENKYRYLKLNFIPHIVDSKIVGFFSFMEDKDPPILYNNINKLISSKELNHKYDHEIYLKSIDEVNSVLVKKNINFDFEMLNKLAINTYIYALSNQHSKTYSEDMINLLISLDFFN